MIKHVWDCYKQQPKLLLQYSESLSLWLAFSETASTVKCLRSWSSSMLLLVCSPPGGTWGMMWMSENHSALMSCRLCRLFWSTNLPYYSLVLLPVPVSCYVKGFLWTIYLCQGVWVFLHWFVCVQNNLKNYELIWMKFSGEMSNGARKKLINFGSDLDLHLKLLAGSLSKCCSSFILVHLSLHRKEQSLCQI